MDGWQWKVRGNIGEGWNDPVPHEGDHGPLNFNPTLLNSVVSTTLRQIRAQHTKKKSKVYSRLNIKRSLSASAAPSLC